MNDILLVNKDILENIEEVRCFRFQSKETYVIVADKSVPIDIDTAKYAIWLWLNKDIEANAD
jgi:hypothetical protein